jgi:hypothetical protein
VVAFYFGARETHYFRTRPVNPSLTVTPASVQSAPTTEDNAALEDWRSDQN